MLPERRRASRARRLLRDRGARPAVETASAGRAVPAVRRQPDAPGIRRVRRRRARVSISHHYWIEEGGIEVLSPPFRYVWPSELDLMARLAGMCAPRALGSWAREPFTSESDEARLGLGEAAMAARRASCSSAAPRRASARPSRWPVRRRDARGAGWRILGRRSRHGSRSGRATSSFPSPSSSSRRSRRRRWPASSPGSARPRPRPPSSSPSTARSSRPRCCASWASGARSRRPGRCRAPTRRPTCRSSSAGSPRATGRCAASTRACSKPTRGCSRTRTRPAELSALEQDLAALDDDQA